jgi:hypothetical protein
MGRELLRWPDRYHVIDTTLNDRPCEKEFGGGMLHSCGAFWTSPENPEPTA